MATIPAKHFSAVEYIKKLRAANITEEQADIFAEAFEMQAQVIQEQSNKISTLENKDLATRRDLEAAKNQIILWVVGIVAANSLFFFGILAKGFHWF